jgi:hypothetical protein
VLRRHDLAAAIPQIPNPKSSLVGPEDHISHRKPIFRSFSLLFEDEVRKHATQLVVSYLLRAIEGFERMGKIASPQTLAGIYPSSGKKHQFQHTSAWRHAKEALGNFLTDSIMPCGKIVHGIDW